MKKIKFFSLILLLLVFAQTTYAKTYNLLFQSSDSQKNANFKLQKIMIDKIKRDSKGKINIKLLPVRTLMQHNETLDAIANGALDGHITATEYFGDVEPALTLLGNPVGAWSSPKQMLDFFNNGGGKELIRSFYEPMGVYFIGASTPGLEAFVARVPINSVADLAGLKIRAPSGLIEDTFKACGAIPIDMPGGDVKNALKIKAIDAADYTVFHTNQSSGLNDVARYPVYPGFHSMALVEVSMNLKKWQSLPKNLQKIISSNVEKYALGQANSVNTKDLAAVRKARSAGIKVINWSNLERKKFRNIAQKQWAIYAKKNAQAQKVYSALIAYLNAKK